MRFLLSPICWIIGHHLWSRGWVYVELDGRALCARCKRWIAVQEDEA